MATGIYLLLVLLHVFYNLSDANNDEYIETHNLGQLRSHEYTINVQLNAPGNIIWTENIYNADTLIKVNKEQDVDDSIEVKVSVDKVKQVITVSSDVIDAYGSKATTIKGEWYMLLLGLFYLWFNINNSNKGIKVLVAVCMLLTVCYTVHGQGDTAQVNVHIQTPIHMVIKTANLQTVDGSINVLPSKVTSTRELVCISGMPTGGLCDSCCYGNGECKLGSCQCFDGFSDMDFCYDNSSTVIGGVGNTENTDVIGVYITVENTMTNDSEVFDYCTYTQHSGSMFNILNYTAQVNPTFTFEDKEFSGLGQYITSMMGLAEDTDKHLAWSFGRRYPAPKPDCLFPVGVSSYYPVDNEHIVFQYITWEDFNNYPTCPVSNDTLQLNFDYNKNYDCLKGD